MHTLIQEAWLGPKFCISNKFPHDTDAAGLWGTLSSEKLIHLCLTYNPFQQL